MVRAIKILFVALMAFTMVSCVEDGHLSMVADLEGGEWREAVQFNVANSDTLSMSDISIFLRCKPSYERVDSLALHLVTIAPDQTRVVEQLTIYFPRSSSDLWRRRIYGEATYRRGVKLNQSGEYRVLIYPQRPTEFVESVGLTLNR